MCCVFPKTLVESFLKQKLVGAMTGPNTFTGLEVPQSYYVSPVTIGCNAVGSGLLVHYESIFIDLNFPERL